HDAIGIAPEAEGRDEGLAARAIRIGRRQLAGHHAAERVADQDGARDAEHGHQLVVAEHEVPESVEMIDVVLSVGRRARVLRRVDREVLRELVEERVPREAPGAVEEDQRRPAALREDPDADPLLPDRDAALLNPARTRGAARGAHPPTAATAIDG